MRRLSRAILVGVLTTSFPAGADVAAQCSADAARGEKARTDHDLRAALYALRACSAPDCPEAVRSRCIESHDTALAAMPSVIVVVRDAAGRDVANAHVVVDGA